MVSRGKSEFFFHYRSIGWRQDREYELRERNPVATDNYWYMFLAQAAIFVWSPGPCKFCFASAFWMIARNELGYFLKRKAPNRTPLKPEFWASCSRVLFGRGILNLPTQRRGLNGIVSRWRINFTVWWPLCKYIQNLPVEFFFADSLWDQILLTSGNLNDFHMESSTTSDWHDQYEILFSNSECKEETFIWQFIISKIRQSRLAYELPLLLFFQFVQFGFIVRDLVTSDCEAHHTSCE